jgi:Holliday junction resolvase RusA-like endonuclease
MVKFIVVGEPVAKGRPRFTRRGIAYTPKKTSEYEELVRLSYFASGARRYDDKTPLKMELKAYFPIPKHTSKIQVEKMEKGEILPVKKPDCDNLMKIVADSLNNIAYGDDKQITEMKITKRYSTTPRVEVEISEHNQSVNN